MALRELDDCLDSKASESLGPLCGLPRVAGWERTWARSAPKFLDVAEEVRRMIAQERT